ARGPRRLQISGIVLCVAALIYYKYFGFICNEILSVLVPSAAFKSSCQALTATAAPLAISFFVFEFVHYHWDVSKGTPVIKSPIKFLQ
ncbi:hypothetical protein ABTE48_19095, partial [Acinetobacter baumannii]